MEQTMRHRATAHRIPIGRLTGAAIALGGLSASVFAGGAADAATSHAARVVVSTAKSAKIGTFLASGKTLYTLNKASKAACNTACLKIWPELLLPKGVTKATAGTGVSAAKLGTVKRAGGALQVTYGGKPLYYFSIDTKAGQVGGDITDTWGTWGAVVTVKAKGSSGSTTGTSSGGTNTGTGGVAF